MLKKLVKYGNSNALVLDRAILDLLNIAEGSVVKLHTDGKSLIITPEHTIHAHEVEVSAPELIPAYLSKKKEKDEEVLHHEHTAHPTKKQRKMQESIKKIVEKYGDAFNNYDHEAFLAKVEECAQKYHGDKQSPEFIEEVKQLQIQYSPLLAAMHKELNELSD